MDLTNIDQRTKHIGFDIVRSLEYDKEFCLHYMPELPGAALIKVQASIFISSQKKLKQLMRINSILVTVVHCSA